MKSPGCCNDVNDVMIDPQNNTSHAFITVRADRKNLKIALDDILYIESLKDYIKIVTTPKDIEERQE